MASKQPDNILKERATALIEWLRRRIIWADYAMTPAEREKWARIRSKGLPAYMVKHIVVFTIGMAVWWAVIDAVFPGIGGHHTLKRDLTEGGALGVLCGFMVAGNIWFRNQSRYSRKPLPNKRIH